MHDDDDVEDDVDDEVEDNCLVDNDNVEVVGAKDDDGVAGGDKSASDDVNWI